MPLWREDQAPKAVHGVLTPGDPTRELLRAKYQVTVRYNSDTSLWEVATNADVGTKWVTTPSQVDYIPPICVRSFILYREVAGTEQDWATLQYDAPGIEGIWGANTAYLYQIRISNKLRTGTAYDKQLTRVYLAGSDSNFTEIYLDG